MLVTNRSEFQRALDTLWQYRDSGFRVDVESTGLDMFKHENPARMCSIQIGPIADMSRNWYFPFRHGEGVNLDLELLAPLRELLAGVLWLGHNLDFDMKMLWCDGFKLPPRILCSLIAAHTRLEHEKQSKAGKPYALKKLAVQYLEAGANDAQLKLKEELKKRGLSTKNGGMENLWRLPAEIVYQYGVDDLSLSQRLLDFCLEHLRRWRTDKVYEELCEFQLVLTRMELRGVQLDKVEVARQMGLVGPRLQELESELAELSGGINIRSPKQLTEWLKLPKTAKDFLQSVLEGEPRHDIRALLDYREVQKAVSTYFDPFTELCDANGRIHTSFKVHGTITGRLSSAGPNMQNCSRDSATRPYSLKRCFKAPEGKFLFEADYSSVEPRLGAYFTKDPGLTEIFQKGLDVYRPTAERMFKVASATDEQRTSAKSVVLGVAYSMGALKLAIKLGLKHHQNADGTYDHHYEPVWTMRDGELQQLACSEVDAKYCACEGRAYIKSYFEAVPEMQPFIKRLIAMAKRNNYMRYPLSGRVKHVEQYWVDGRLRDNGHKFYNFLLQGSAADIMRKALVAIDRSIPEDRAALLLTVHDSALLEVTQGPGAKETCDEILRIMETTTRIDPIPLVVDGKFGPNWSNMAKYQRMC